MTDTMSDAIRSEFIQLNMGTSLEWELRRGTNNMDSLKDSDSESTHEPEANPCGGSIPTTTESSEDEDGDSAMLLTPLGFQFLQDSDPESAQPPKVNSWVSMPKFQNAHRNASAVIWTPTMLNSPSSNPWEREIISRTYLARYGSERASFERDDDGTLIVPKVESIKRELRLAQQAASQAKGSANLVADLDQGI